MSARSRALAIALALTLLLLALVAGCPKEYQPTAKDKAELLEILDTPVDADTRTP